MHPRHQVRDLCVRVCVLRPLGGDVRPCHRARVVSGTAEEGLTSQHGELHAALRLLALALRDATAPWPTVLVACARKQTVEKKRKGV